MFLIGSLRACWQYVLVFAVCFVQHSLKRVPSYKKQLNESHRCIPPGGPKAENTEVLLNVSTDSTLQHTLFTTQKLIYIPKN